MIDVNKVVDFPKIQCPFVRVKRNGGYYATPEINPGFEWVFEEKGVIAVDKLHGTNICVNIDKHGYISSIHNRGNVVIEHPALCTNIPSDAVRFIEGVLYAMKKGYIEKQKNTKIYGELIGPNINGNIHNVNEFRFIPFTYLKMKKHWNSWIRGDYPKTFDAIKDWMKHYQSLYSRTDGEGVVFYHPDGRMAKVRKDMFE